MDESSLHISHNLDNDLIRELVELREMRNDRENLLRANHYYASKLTSMELKISEYKALNETKDLEINKLKSRMRSLMHREIEIEKESTKASFTWQKHELEYGSDRELTENLEIERLKLEAKRLHQDNNELKKRLEDSNSELKSSQKGYSDLVRILHETRSEKDYLKNEMIPHLEKTLQLYQEYKKEQEAELEYYKFGMETPILRNHDEKKYRKSPQLSSRSASRMSPGLKKYVQIKMPNSARTIIARSEHKNITKQRSSPVITTQRTRMDDLEFADSFPDEEELDGY